MKRNFSIAIYVAKIFIGLIENIVGNNIVIICPCYFYSHRVSGHVDKCIVDKGHVFHPRSINARIPVVQTSATFKTNVVLKSNVMKLCSPTRVVFFFHTKSCRSLTISFKSRISSTVGEIIFYHDIVRIIYIDIN